MYRWLIAGFAGAAGNVETCAGTDPWLLQLQLSLDTEPGTELLRRAEPLKFLHIPKCGASFLNALIHLPGVCPEVDLDYRVDEDYLSKSFERDFWHQCPKVCDESKFTCNSAHNTHEGLGVNFETYKGHLVTMLRQPEQRILSAYHDTRWDHGASRFANASSYAKAVQGLMTCQLMGNKSVDPMPKCEVTEADAHAAARRLREGFVFVGILEEWDLSMCLLHQMLGGPCLYSDFEDDRPSNSSSPDSSYDVTELEGFRDVLDRLVYDEARKIFQEKLVAYNVTAESCAVCRMEAIATGRLEQLHSGVAGHAPLALLLWLSIFSCRAHQR